ncbi:sodium:calcium antiporter [Pseudomonas matsuisoli]|nr:sodium:calcium antiporter [Pseudomonas matsuisoli]
MSPSVYVYLGLGLLLMTLGAHAVIRGLIRLTSRGGGNAVAAGLIVLIVLAMPDTAVSLKATGDGLGDLAIGSVVGSGIANLFLLLGVAAVLLPLRASSFVVKQTMPAFAAAIILVWLLAEDGTLTGVDGGLLLAAFTAYCLWLARSHGQFFEDLHRLTQARVTRGNWSFLPVSIEITATLAGIALLIAGAEALTKGAVELARELGLSDLVVGLTATAGGTALPELLVCIVAALRGRPQIAIGLLIASGMINLLFVLGLSVLIAPGELSVSPNALSFDIPTVLFAGAVVMLLLAGNRIIGRVGGLILLGYYGIYVLYLALFSAGMPQFEAYRHAVVWYVVPGSLVVLSAWAVWRARRVASLNV